jgi:hypothetical protein
MLHEQVLTIRLFHAKRKGCQQFSLGTKELVADGVFDVGEVIAG